LPKPFFTHTQQGICHGAGELKRPLGIQLVVEFFACDEKVLDNAERIEEIMLEAATEAEATIVNHCFHKFTPQGVSGVVVIAESHIAIHTWPEFGYCAVDIFTCGDLIDNNRALEVLKSGFRSQEEKVFRIERGLMNRSQRRLSALPIAV
jgi:S-adenosylmethionine decarboxylase